MMVFGGSFPSTFEFFYAQRLRLSSFTPFFRNFNRSSLCIGRSPPLQAAFFFPAFRLPVCFGSFLFFYFLSCLSGIPLYRGFESCGPEIAGPCLLTPDFLVPRFFLLFLHVLLSSGRRTVSRTRPLSTVFPFPSFLAPCSSSQIVKIGVKALRFCCRRPAFLASQPFAWSLQFFIIKH